MDLYNIYIYIAYIHAWLCVCLSQAVSVVVLGKLCLQHESQAKRIIPALGRLLDTNPGPDIKTNIVMTLSDMCVR